MKSFFVYTLILGAIISTYSCSSQWECYNDNPMYYVVCTNNGDTITYFSSAVMAQSVEAKKYYESTGYTCVDTLRGSSNYYNWKKVYSDKEVKQLEEIGYECKSIGP